MQLTNTLLLAAAITGQAFAAKPKANEYKTHDCKNLNYGHHNDRLKHVTMDDSSHSVYIDAGGKGRRWEAWAKKSKNGGVCTGQWLGYLTEQEPGCVNLDAEYGNFRIKCLTLEG